MALIDTNSFVTAELLEKFKEKMNDVCVYYNCLIDKQQIKNRESKVFETKIAQSKTDLSTLSLLRNSAQDIIDMSNKIIFNIMAFDEYKKLTLIQDTPEPIDTSVWDDDM